MRSPTAPAPSTPSAAPASRAASSVAPGDAARDATAGGAGFGVYVHWPFCAQKCPYCDFNSHVRHGGVDEARFLDAYLAELTHTRELIGARTVDSIFLGGGTPSLMAPATVAAILDKIAALWPLSPAAEITLEANPGSVEAGRFRGYRSAGINRVSLGVQSLDDAELRALGRIHSAAEAKAAVAIARDTFDRYSFDLIYARPRQTPATWRSELSEALTLAGGHLSLYQLTIEPQTPYAALHAAGKLTPPDADLAHELYDITQELTQAAGLPAYEISNHARPGEESRHNLIYWRYGEYAGVGPGAHGRIIVGGDRHATSTERQPERWLDAVERDSCGIIERTRLTPAEEADEMLLMGLRLAEGIDLGRLAAATGAVPSPQSLAELASLGFIESAPDMPGGAGPATLTQRIRATAKGRFVLNEIVLRLSLGLANERGAQSAMDTAAGAD